VHLLRNAGKERLSSAVLFNALRNLHLFNVLFHSKEPTTAGCIRLYLRQLWFRLLAKEQGGQAMSDPPKEWTSDEIWNIVKDRVNDQLKIFWILGSFVSALVFAVGVILAVGGVRDELVKHWLVDVDAKIDGYLGKVVAYSFGGEFLISSGSTGRNFHKMPFYKTNRDRGVLRCKATYPTNLIKNKITVTYNDKKEPTHEIPLNGDMLRVDIPEDDKAFFDSARTPFQHVTFLIDRAAAFPGAITINCWIL
jgi:hypothetical protein